MFIVTAGKAFNDIDAFGCAVAYAELLRKEGKDATAVFVGPLNHSVTPIALNQDIAYLVDYSVKPEDKLVYVDLSDPAHFAFPGADESQVFEVFDHHYGWEEYWRIRLGERSHIERVGAAGTLIWEEFKKRHQMISSAGANVLALAILQNTLNFTSSETNDRDRAAFRDLLGVIDLPEGWQGIYFSECGKEMHRHFEESLRSDTKVFDRYFGEEAFVFSQLEIMEDPIIFLEQYKENIHTFWSEYRGARCLLNLADISSKTSLLYAADPVWLQEKICPLFSEMVQVTPQSIRIPIHQRKQILKLLQD